MHAHRMAGAAQEAADAPITVARVLDGQSLHGIDPCNVLHGQAQLLAQARARRACGLTTFCVDFLEHGDVQISLGQKALQPRILGLDRAPPFDIRQRELAEMLAPDSTGCPLTLCLLAVAATDVASASRSTAIIGSSLNRRFLTGSSPPKSHLPRNPRPEKCGQVRPTRFRGSSQQPSAGTMNMV